MTEVRSPISAKLSSTSAASSVEYSHESKSLVSPQFGGSFKSAMKSNSGRDTFDEKDIDDVIQMTSELGVASLLDSGTKSQPSASSSKVSSATAERRASKMVGLACLPEQSRKFSYCRGGSFTLMVAGSSGTGKTTFINTLFGTHLVESKTDTVSTTHITLNRFKLVEQGFQLNLTVIDTPGFGLMIDNQYAWVPITRFIDEQFRLFLFQTEQPERKQVCDTRVHVCLYFIVPGGGALTPIDIESMRELSKRVNLIPVIAKSDTLSAKDLTKFKSIVKKTLIYESIPVCDLILDENVTEKINATVPFAVFGSNNFYPNEDGQLVRGRKYKWGVAEVENPNHCDFVHLREILMSENMLDLISSTTSHYEKYRQGILSQRYNQSKNLHKDLHLSNGESGFDQFVIYNKISFTTLEEQMREYDPILEAKENYVKESFSDIIATQENRFKEWKKALVEKQNAFNIDIEKDHTYLLKLQKITESLEQGKRYTEYSPDIEYDDFKTHDFPHFQSTDMQDSELAFR